MGRGFWQCPERGLGNWGLKILHCAFLNLVSFPSILFEVGCLHIMNMMLSNARPTSPNGFLPPYRFWMMDPSLLWPLMLTPPNPDGSSSAEMAKSLRFSVYVIRIMALQSPRYQIIQLNRNLQTRPVFAIWDGSRSSFWPDGRKSFQRVDFSYHFFIFFLLLCDWV